MSISFNALFSPSTKRPHIQFETQSNLNRTINAFENGTNLSTYLAIAGLIQALLLQLLPLPYALSPACILLAYGVIVAVLVSSKTLPNPYMPEVVMHRATAQLPDRQGSMPTAIGAESFAVFLLGAQCNHPLGMLAPGFKELGDWLRGMCEELSSSREGGKYGSMLYSHGSFPWSSTTATGGYKYMGVFYFRSVADLHAYAHSPLHRKTWRWWEAHVSLHPHIGIWHETYSLDPGKWENFYQQCVPAGLGAVTVPRRGAKSDKGKETEWVRTLIALGKGDKMTIMKGRFGDEL